MMSGVVLVLFLSEAGGAGSAMDPAPRLPGETLYLRLNTRLSSRLAKPGQAFSASTIRPLVLHDETALPAGTRLEGTVAAARGVGLGLKHERARLALNFTRLTLPDGRQLPLEASLTSVDNAREEIDQAGRIRGIRATNSLGERMNVRLGGLRLSAMPIAYRSLVAAYPVEMLPLWFANALIFGLTDPEIDLPAGAELQIRLKDPWPHPERFPAYRGERPEVLDGHDEALRALVSRLPAMSQYAKSQSEADPVNVVLIGSPAAAFRAAGWQGSQPRSRSTCFRAVRAIATSAPYPQGPMNPLLLDGRAPDAEWQKGLNTYAKRHHLRAWAAHEVWDDAPVWLVAATHDTGLVVRGAALTHGIDHQVDREREKVLADLMLTGCVDAVHYVHRPIFSQRPWRSDGHVAVVRLNSCAAPRNWNDGLAADDELPGHGLGWRLLQRLTLNARNSLLRENHAYRGYELVRHLVLWRRMNRPETGEAM